MSDQTVDAPPPLPDQYKESMPEYFGALVLFCIGEHPYFVKSLDVLTESEFSVYYMKLGLNTPGALKYVGNPNPEEVLASLDWVLSQEGMEAPALPVYTVHASSMLCRLLRLAELRFQHTQYRNFSIGHRVVDLVEYFHKPEVLTYSDRKSFSADRVLSWLPEANTGSENPHDNAISVCGYLAQLHNNGYGEGR